MPKIIENIAVCRNCTEYIESRDTINGITNVYNERLKSILSDSNTDFSPLDLGCPHKSLLNSGLPNQPIQVSVRILKGKSKQENHPFKLPDIAHLPNYLATPIAVFRSATTVSDTKVILTEMESNGVNILVIISPNREYKGVLINDIRSIYPKDNIKPILEWICKDNLLEYFDKQKILNWLSKHQYNPDEVTKLIKDCTKIIQEM